MKGNGKRVKGDKGDKGKGKKGTSERTAATLKQYEKGECFQCGNTSHPGRKCLDKKKGSGIAGLEEQEWGEIPRRQY